MRSRMLLIYSLLLSPFNARLSLYSPPRSTRSTSSNVSLLPVRLSLWSVLQADVRAVPAALRHDPQYDRCNDRVTAGPLSFGGKVNTSAL